MFLGSWKWHMAHAESMKSHHPVQKPIKVCDFLGICISLKF